MMGFQKAMFKYQRVPVFVSQSMFYVQCSWNFRDIHMLPVSDPVVVGDVLGAGGHGWFLVDDGCSGQSAITQATTI